MTYFEGTLTPDFVKSAQISKSRKDAIGLAIVATIFGLFGALEVFTITVGTVRFLRWLL